MEKYFDQHIAKLKLKNVRTFAAPSQETISTTHGGFDDDTMTMNKIIELIKQR